MKYEVDPKQKFEKAIKKSLKQLNDLTIPYNLMARSWFKSNVSIFDEGRKSKGKYEDLSPKYKSRKARLLGSPYPILRGFVKEKGSPARKSGKLADSMTNPSHKDAVNLIVNKKILVLGTKVLSKKGAPYARFLHFGTNKMSARPLALIGGEQVATRQVNERRENWIKLLNDFVIQKSKGFAS